MKRTIRIQCFAAISGLALALTASAQSTTTTITEGPGGYSRNTTVVGANGKTATYQNNATWGNGSYTDTRSYTGRNGATRTDTVTRSAGTVTNTFTGRNGNTRTATHPVGYRHFRR